MPQFVFKLDGVLRHRRRTEQEAQRAVAAKQAVAAELERELTALKDDLTGATDALRGGRLTGPLDLTYLAAHRRYAADVTRRGTALVGRIAAARKLVDEARKVLAEAAKQRKILETLREQHFERWKAERARRDLAEADDAAGRMAYANQREQVDAADAAEEKVTG